MNDQEFPAKIKLLTVKNKGMFFQLLKFWGKNKTISHFSVTKVKSPDSERDILSLSGENVTG